MISLRVNVVYVTGKKTWRHQLQPTDKIKKFTVRKKINSKKNTWKINVQRSLRHQIIDSEE